MRQQALEYEALYEKARVMLSRLARRAKEDSPCPDPDPANGRDPVSQRILARRNRHALSQSRITGREG